MRWTRACCATRSIARPSASCSTSRSCPPEVLEHGGVDVRPGIGERPADRAEEHLQESIGQAPDHVAVRLTDHDAGELEAAGVAEGATHAAVGLDQPAYGHPECLAHLALLRDEL